MFLGHLSGRLYSSIPIFCLVFFWFFFSLTKSSFAGNDDGILLGPDAIRYAGAVTANVSDGSSLYYNPAGMGQINTEKLEASTSAFRVRSLRFSPLISLGDTASSASDIHYLSLPSTFAYVMRASKKVSLGAGVFAPKSEKSSFDAKVTQGGARARYSTETSTTTTQLALGIGVRITDRLLFGSTLMGSLQTDSNTGFFTGSAGEKGKDGIFSFGIGADNTQLGLRAGFGVQYAYPSGRLGFAVYSPTLIWFNSSSSRGQTLGNVNNQQIYAINSVGNQPYKLSWGQPFRFRAGIAQRFDSFTFMLDGDVQTPLTLNGLRRELLFNVRAAIAWQSSRLIEFSFGAFTDGDALRSGFFRNVDYRGLILATTIDAEIERKVGPPAKLRTVVGLRLAYGSGEAGGLHIVHSETKPLQDARVQVSSFQALELTLSLGSTFGR